MTTVAAAPATTETRWRFFRRNAPYLIVYALILVIAVFGTLSSERFLTDRNLLNVFRQTAFLGTIALGQTLVILTGGIDLSVGSLVKLSVLVSAILMNGESSNMGVAIAATLGLGVLVGFIHGLLITRLNVPPFVVTLGSYSILYGIALTITTNPIGRAAPEMLRFYDLRIGPIYAPTIVFIILLVALSFVLRRTTFGRYIYAVGGNEQVARLSGIPVKRVKFGVYILCSLLASLTGLFWLSRMGIGDPVIGDGLELQTITAAILGGTSLFGGRGSLWGTLGGALLLSLTANVLVVLNVNQWIQQLIQGAIILTAVALYKHKSR